MAVVIGGLLNPTDREAAIGGTCLRLAAYASTASRLEQPQDFQVLSACARSCLELSVDVEFLTRGELCPNAVEKFHEFTRLARFRAAKQLAAFYDRHIELNDQATEHRALIETPGVASELESVAARLWGTNAKKKPIMPDHWTGLTLADRCQRSGVEFEEFYRRFGMIFNWHVHSGASGTGGLSEGSLRTVELLARETIARFVPEAFRKVGVELHLHRAMPDFAILIRDLVGKVELETFSRLRSEQRH
jgi:hypothetical protein